MNTRRLQGFTLLEMATVLGIIALIMGFALTIGDNAIRAAQRIQTQQRMKTVQSAIENYVRINGYYPCPFSRTLLPSSPAFGVAYHPGGPGCGVNLPGLVSASTAVGGVGFIGGVPVRTLGLPDSFAGDAWGNKFLYGVGQLQTVALGAYANPMIRIFYGDRTGTNYILSNPAIQANNGVVGSGATYVLISHGPDGRGAYPVNGTQVAVACGTGNQDDVANCDDADMDFYDDDYNDGTPLSAQFFDDYVLWGSNTLVHSRDPIAPVLGCTSGCEAWCAPCLPNALVPNSNLPTDTFNINGAILCKKIVTSTSPCTATCLWSGNITTDANRYQACP